MPARVTGPRTKGAAVKKLVLAAGLALAGTLSILPACDDGVRPRTPFAFQVTVVDSAGKPMPGVLVSAWNRFAPTAWWLGGPGVTEFEFLVPQPCSLTVGIFDLQGHRFATRYDGQVRVGSYRMSWSLGRDMHDGAYRCRFVFRNVQSGQIVYQDSVLAYHASNEVLPNRIGTTGADGKVETREHLLFPSLFDLGTLVFRSIFDTTLTTFVVRDSVRIGLSMPSGLGAVWYDRALSRGENVYRLQYASFRALRSHGAGPTTGGRMVLEPSISLGNTVRPPAGFKVYPNVPNPF